MTDTTADARCMNCATPLQGPHCHVCGQSARNPLKHLRDALADAFDSLFDIDGRILRTLRDLVVPGQVAMNYLAGHRVRYVPPLRLFLTLSVITFFVAHFAIDKSGIQLGDMDNTAIAAATTQAQVEAARQVQLDKLAAKRAALPDDPSRSGRLAGIEGREQNIRQTADARIEQLKNAQAAGLPPPPPMSDVDNFTINDKPWHPVTNPFKSDRLPAFANAWINEGIGRGIDNFRRYLRDQNALKDAWLAAIPTALVLLLPVFALLLRLFYAFSPWSWLEHLVVALYSHAFMLGMALLGMLTVLVTRGTAWAGTGQSAAAWLLPIVALYLLSMQKRVYRQHWPMTLLKYWAIGTVYSVLIGVGALLALGAVFLD